MRGRTGSPALWLFSGRVKAHFSKCVASNLVHSTACRSILSSGDVVGYFRIYIVFRIYPSISASAVYPGWNVDAVSGCV